MLSCFEISCIKVYFLEKEPHPPRPPFENDLVLPEVWCFIGYFKGKISNRMKTPHFEFWFPFFDIFFQNSSPQILKIRHPCNIYCEGICTVPWWVGLDSTTQPLSWTWIHSTSVREKDGSSSPSTSSHSSTIYTGRNIKISI